MTFKVYNKFTFIHQTSHEDKAVKTPNTSLSLSKQIAFSALFAALCLIGTMVIPIPLPTGYFKVGDVFVLLAAWFLGPLYGSLAAGVGSALADLFMGYTLYAPFTFIIKGLDALVAYLVWSFLKKFINKANWDSVPRFLSALVGETIMVLGYLLVETLFYGFPVAVTTLLGNTTQGGCCLLLATIIMGVFYRIKAIKRLFPHFEVNG